MPVIPYPVREMVIGEAVSLLGMDAVPVLYVAVKGLKATLKVQDSLGRRVFPLQSVARRRNSLVMVSFPNFTFVLPVFLMITFWVGLVVPTI